MTSDKSRQLIILLNIEMTSKKRPYSASVTTTARSSHNQSV
jgi:hypothetical protein